MSSHTSWWFGRLPISAAVTLAIPLHVACVSKLDNLKPSATNEPVPGSPTNGHTTEPRVTSPASSDAEASEATSSANSNLSSTRDATTVSQSSADNETSTADVTPSSADGATSVAPASDPASTSDAGISTTTDGAEVSSRPDVLSTGRDDATNPAAPAFFTTADGLLAWFDAHDDDSFAAGAAVAAWNDRSGNDNHLVQATSSAQPTRVERAFGDLPAVRFDGSNDALATTTPFTNRAFHGFVVWQSTRVPPSTKSTLMANSRNFEVNHGHITETAKAAVSTCVSSNCYTTNSGWYDAKFERGAAANTAYLWQFAFLQATTDLVAEAWGGSLVTQTGPTELPVAPATPFYVGNCDAANCGFLGDIGELVLFARPLTNDEKTQAVTYLTSKWSLQEPNN